MCIEVDDTRLNVDGTRKNKKEDTTHPLNERERRRGKRQKREREIVRIEAIKVHVTTERRNIPNGIHNTNRTETTERRNDETKIEYVPNGIHNTI